MSDLEPVRQSDLKSAELCGEYFYRRKILKDPDYSGTAAMRGSAVHQAAQDNHVQKIKTHQDLPASDLVDRAVASFDEKRERFGFRLTPEEMAVGVNPTLARTRDTVARVTKLYAKDVAPTLQPALVEQKIRARLPNGIVLEGTIDLTTLDDRIKDLKTTSSTRGNNAVHQEIQAPLYDILFSAHMKRPAKGFDLEILVDADTTYAKTVQTTVTAADRRALVARIETHQKMRAAGIFPPAPVGSWFCGPRWCGFWDSCRYVNSERRAAAAKLTQEGMV